MAVPSGDFTRDLNVVSMVSKWICIVVFKVSSTSIRRSKTGRNSALITNAEEFPSGSWRFIACCATSFRMRVNPPRLANFDISEMQVFSFCTDWRSGCGSFMKLNHDCGTQNAFSATGSRTIRGHGKSAITKDGTGGTATFFQFKGWQVSQKLTFEPTALSHTVYM